MDNKHVVDQMIERCLEQDEQAYEEIRAEFEERIANLDTMPAVSRIQELEKIWGELNAKRKAIASDAVLTLLQSINEDELIDSKKASTKKEG